MAPKIDFNRLMIICDKIKSYPTFQQYIWSSSATVCNNITPNSNAITCGFNSLLAGSRQKTEEGEEGEEEGEDGVKRRAEQKK